MSAAELVEHLKARVARWWIPEHWSFVEAIPLTGVGKYDKARLRKQHARGDLLVMFARVDAERRPDTAGSRARSLAEADNGAAGS